MGESELNLSKPFVLFLKGTEQHDPAEGSMGLELMPVSELLLLEFDVPLWTSILHQYKDSKKLN